MEENQVIEPLNEVITFDPPLLTIDNRIDGNAYITSAEILPPDCEEKIIARLTGYGATDGKSFQDGMVIAVPNVGDARQSIIAALAE